MKRKIESLKGPHAVAVLADGHQGSHQGASRLSKAGQTYPSVFRSNIFLFLFFENVNHQVARARIGIDFRQAMSTYVKLCQPLSTNLTPSLFLVAVRGQRDWPGLELNSNCLNLKIFP